MKKHSENAARLVELLDQLKQSVEVEPLPERTCVEHLIYACLLWNTTRNQADQAFSKLRKSVVDWNDLRVTDPLEIAEVLGSRFSKVEERSYRLVTVLRSVYELEHAVEMDSFADMPKREARAKLEELEGIVPFVSASVLLLALGAHAMPVDDQLVARLKADGVVEEDATLEQVQSFLEHHVRADDGVATYQLLRAYVEKAAKVELGDAPATRPSKTRTNKTTKGRATKTTKASTKSKTTKKTTTKKTAARR